MKVEKADDQTGFGVKFTEHFSIKNPILEPRNSHIIGATIRKLLLRPVPVESVSDAEIEL